MKYRVVSVKETSQSQPVYYIEQQKWGIWRSMPGTGGYFQLEKATAHCDVLNNKVTEIKKVVYP